MKTTLPIEGTQHTTIPQRMARLYEELYTSIPEKIDKTKLSAFFPIKGRNYGKSHPRIMVVGRCVNGWEELKDKTAESFATTAADKMVYTDGFEWIDKEDHVSTYIEDGKTMKYNINRSAFWRVAKGVVYKTKPWLEKYKKAGCELTKENIDNIDNSITRWFEHIVWTNLYAVAPKNGGNISGKIKKAINNISGKLLLEQIRFYKPTHIIFITDWDYWFEDFADKFPNVKKISEDKNENIVGIGETDGIKAIIVRRPETRNNEKMVKQISKKLFEGSNPSA